MGYDCSRQRSLPTFATMIVQTNIPSKNLGLLLSRTTLTPKTCGLLLMETTKDSSVRYFPLSQTIGDEYVFLFAMSRTIADSSGRCYLLSRTMVDESVFHSSMSNRLSDRYPCRGVLNTPHNHSRKGYLIACQTIVGRMQYAPTLPAEKSDLKGWRGITFGAKGEESVFHSIMFNRLSDRYPGRAQKHTPLARLSSTPTPFAGRLVGRMQYAPTLSEKEEVSSDRCFLLSRTMADEYVFHSIMSNRLSDRYPCRGVLNTPLARLSSTLSPLAGCLVGRMQYAPTLPEKDEVSLGRYYLLYRTMRDKYVF